MENTALNLVSLMEKIPDPRINRTKKHKLSDIIVLTTCAVICGFDSFESIEMFCKHHENWFKTFLKLPNGIPSHDTISRVFSMLDPKDFNEKFIEWTSILAENFKGKKSKTIAIDGQTLRGAKKPGEKRSSIHLVSAWASDQGLTLGHLRVKEKSNEITAIPNLLDMIKVKGYIVTIDAMGCQHNIAEKVIKKKADYIFGLKGNQGKALEAVVDHFELSPESISSSFEEYDKGHGRLEHRLCEVSASSTVYDLKDWKGLQSVIKITSTREIKNKKTVESRYYLSSLDSKEAKKIALAIRSHWGIENSLHHVLDVTFNQDKSRIMKDHAPENMSTVRKMTLNMIKKAPKAKKSGDSYRLRRQRAAIDKEYLLEILSYCGVKI